MASFESLKKQIFGKIPHDLRPHYEGIVAEWVESSILKISKIWNWDWRHTQQDISISASTHTYEMNPDCDMISAQDAILLDSNSKPTKNRVTYLPEDRFNDLYIREQGDTETAATPKYFVPLTAVTGTGNMQIRAYPVPDASYTLRVYYYTKPSRNDAMYMIEDLILYDVYSKMPAAIEPEATTWAIRYRELKRELKPQERKSERSPPAWTQDVWLRKHFQNQVSRQGRK